MFRSELAQGRPTVVAHPDGCEMLVLAGVASTTSIAFLIRHGSGFVTVAMPDDRLAALELPSQTAFDATPGAPALRVAVDARANVTTGISARDRAVTIRLLGDSSSTPDEFVRPGHVIPVRADLDGNRLPGVAETAAMAGLAAAHDPVVAMCSLISNSDPTRIATPDEGRQFARDRHLAFAHSWEITRMFYREWAEYAI